MNARALYSAEDTTTEMSIDGHRLTAQTFSDGGGMVQVFDENNDLARRILFSKVYLIDVTHKQV